MKDPTRIAPMVSALQDLWEALPGMAFADILRLLEGECFEYLSDEEAAAKLQELTAKFPRTLGDGVRCAELGKWRVTVDADLVVVWGTDIAPAAWCYDRFVSAQVGYPLHVIDKEGEHRRFGVIERIQPVPEEKVSHNEMPPLERATIGDAVYAIIGSDGSKAVIGRKLQVFEVGRRETAVATHDWTSVSPARIGGTAEIVLAGGQRLITIQNTDSIYRLR